MKKRYTETEYSTRNERRKRIVEKKRKKGTKRNVKPRNLAIAKRTSTRPAQRTITIVAPRNFSLIKNTQRMMQMYEYIRTNSRAHKPIFLDMSAVEHLEQDGLLYVLALFEYCKRKYNYNEARGNAPSDEFARNALLESGFYDHVDSNLKEKYSSDDILEIQSGTDVQPEIAQRVIDFARKSLDLSGTTQTQPVYKTIIECMANTKNHAYKPDNVQPKWYLVAMHDRAAKEVKFSFLDGGLGIPRTIRKKPQEKILRYFFGGSIESVSDANLIHSALTVEQARSQTEQRGRGKGLPMIFDNQKEGLIRDLVFISNNGFLNYSSDEFKDLDTTFSGTLISWVFSNN